MKDQYVSNLPFPNTLKAIRDEVYEQLQIQSDTISFFNENEVIETKPDGYTYEQILGYIAECACGFEIINRLGNGELREYSTNVNKKISKGVFKDFEPSENYVIIQKIKYFEGIIGEGTGHVLELSDDNPFISSRIAQNIYDKMRGFRYIVYTQKAAEADIATDCGDKILTIDKKGNEFESFIMQNSWEFDGSISQNWSAKGENELDNTYSDSKGPLAKTLQRIEDEKIPSIYEEAVAKATELITKFNGGYVIKKDGELFICDNEDIDKAKKMWRWNLNGLGYSSNGLNGPFGTAMTMDGQIVADFIKTGVMSADRIKGGKLQLGGANNLNGLFQLLNDSGVNIVQIDNTGIHMADGTGLIGGDGIYTSLSFSAKADDTYFKATGQGDFELVGFVCDASGNLQYQYAFIDAFIPKNFTIKSAYLNLQHIPLIVENASYKKMGYGTCAKMKLYTSDAQGQKMYISPLSDVSLGTISLQDTNVLGSAGWSPTKPTTENNAKLEEKSVQIPISNFKTDKINRFVLGSSISTPTVTIQDINGPEVTALLNSGLVVATITVLGFMSGISF